MDFKKLDQLVKDIQDFSKKIDTFQKENVGLVSEERVGIYMKILLSQLNAAKISFDQIPNTISEIRNVDKYNKLIKDISTLSEKRVKS